ncbi:MAG: L,D-transpeptidase [Rhodobacter sp.]|uniref:L,D-transpeptidase n=1 Tax=Pararhodobacter sp. TaxID=2127056 RepID=UPI001DCD1E7B|nr:L,D-transpeptidase [Pararhodobacter sp.]MCB1344770.1 L,D-transpeptidase [Paracoccaceae bacterium]MCC0074169.1 L,D-transpeptidase [Rhodobacter sp.]HPD93133.1 L,D-transpeptidase [Pararhodobacter sp.]
MTSRRQFLFTSSAALAAPFLAPARALASPADWDTWDAEVTPPGYIPEISNPWGLQPRFLPRRVQANPGLRAGDIHVDAVARYLYHIHDDGTAMRYGVALGRNDLYQPGVFTVGRKAKWPQWTPTATMIARDPDYAQYADGMPGGPTNPLGSRALYLYSGGRDTYLRIHGTPQPRSVGYRASSGCVRMVMAHIIDLYENVQTGATVYLYPAEEVSYTYTGGA